MKVVKWAFCLTSALGLAGCMSTGHIDGNGGDIDYDKASGGGRYSILRDHAPSGDIKVDHLPDLVPKYEPKSRGGNKSPYEVWGKKYTVMDSAQGYEAQGTASWYGQKFHGHKTSNGETYDMYAFSAAHKSLPLPTYLKVTNLDNQRSVIVRVNDRGPFHGDRLIDLSYAAAARLDYHKKGLARVRVEAITPKPGQRYQPKTAASKSGVKAIKNPPKPAAIEPTPSFTNVKAPSNAVSFTHLQLGAFSKQASAKTLENRLLEQYDTTINIEVLHADDGLFKVLVGPYKNESALLKWQQKLAANGLGENVKVGLTP